jgi:hypothetical protein
LVENYTRHVKNTLCQTKKCKYRKKIAQEKVNPLVVAIQKQKNKKKGREFITPIFFDVTIAREVFEAIVFYFSLLSSIINVIMRSWGNLPEEILQLIFESNGKSFYKLSSGIQQEDIYQCMRVCKNWKLPAQHVGYYMVVFTNEASLLKLVRAFSNSKDSPGHFVKHLGMYYHGKKSFRDTCIRYLDSLATLLPRVEYLDLPNTNPDFYSKLIDIHSNSNWKSLKYWGHPDQDCLDLYATCALLYKDTVNNLLMCDKPWVGEASDNSLYYGQYRRLYNKLDQFSSIEDLYFRRHSNDSVEQFDSVFIKVPKVKILNIGIYPVADRVVPRSNQPTIDLSLVAPQPSVESFDLSSAMYDDNSLLYIMHKFPSVKSLHINTERDEFDEDDYIHSKLISTDSNITAATLAKFIDFTTATQHYSVDINLKCRVIADALLEYSEGRGANAFGPLVLKYVAHSSEQLRNAENENSAELLLRKTQFWEYKNGITIHYNAKGHQLPHLYAIERCGQFVEVLIIQMDADNVKLKQISKETNRDAYNLATGYYLDHIFLHCPKLKRLYLENSEFVHCNPNITQSKSITHLHLNKVTFGSDMFPELSARLPSLKYLEMINCQSFSLLMSNTHDGFVDMGYTSFDSIYMKYTYSNLIMEYFFVKISTEKGEKYFKLTMDPEARNYATENIDIRQYEEISLRGVRTFKIHLRCKSINAIHIEALAEGSSYSVHGKIRL